MTSSHGRPPLPLLIGFGFFVVAIMYLLAASMTPRDVPTFMPTPVAELGSLVVLEPDAEGGIPRVDTITIDATNPEQWRYFRFRDGALLEPPDTLQWDLAIRRYHLRVAGPAADLGAPGHGTMPSHAVFRGADGRDDSGHPVLRRWYRYGVLTHLLESKGHSYLLRTRDGGLARLEVLSYYCPGPRPGCMTVRYAYPLH